MTSTAVVTAVVLVEDASSTNKSFGSLSICTNMAIAVMYFNKSCCMPRENVEEEKMVGETQFSKICLSCDHLQHHLAFIRYHDIIAVIS